MPLGTAMHCPRLPGTAQDRQVPVQAVAQQTDCAQTPEAHSDAAAHPAPGGFGPQLPLTQAAPATQSAFEAQRPRQPVSPSHRY